jgi:hypothetical protein
MAGHGEEKSVFPPPGFEGRRIAHNEPLCLIELFKTLYSFLVHHVTWHRLLRLRYLQIGLARTDSAYLSGSLSASSNRCSCHLRLDTFLGSTFTRAKNIVVQILCGSLNQPLLPPSPLHFSSCRHSCRFVNVNVNLYVSVLLWFAITYANLINVRQTYGITQGLC